MAKLEDLWLATESGGLNIGNRPTITCDLETKLKDVNEYPFLVYDRCNEIYRNSFMRFLSRLSGIDHAVFICGDGQHVLALSSLLQNGNKLMHIDVVDRNPRQLTYFDEMVNDYNKMAENIAPLLPRQGACADNPIRGRFRYNTQFHLYQSDIFEYIKNIKETAGGVYFIYLSNVLFDGAYTDWKESDELLNYIQDSKVFKDRTIVHMQYRLDYPVIINKENGEWKNIDFSRGKDEYAHVLKKDSEGLYTIGYKKKMTMDEHLLSS